MFKKIEKWFYSYRYRKWERGLINCYVETLKQIKSPFEKSFGISKIGDIVHKIKVNDVEITSREPLFIKENNQL